MKFVLFFSILCSWSNELLSQPLSANSKTKIYLVRHAEKESGSDPVLTTAGKKRAGDLMRKLMNKHLRHVYVSQYRRTQMTADSMRIQLGIDTVHYTADTTGEDLFNTIRQHNDWGKTILVVGHSNTILRIAMRLGVKNNAPLEIPDNEFDNLFLLQYKKGKAILSWSKYGMPSKTTTSIQSMK